MCTGIRLIAQNGAVIHARTLEFAKNIESKIVILPRNYQLQGTGPAGKADGLSWKSKYAAMGANACGLPVIIDGVNEAGLAGGLFYFPEYAQYQDANQEQIKQTIAPWELLTWILTNFATIDEVKNNLPQIKVTNTIFGPWEIVPPVHATIHDMSGKSLVIEYLKGNLVMTDNPIGVFTNAPSFDWHLTNLRNYINITAQNVSKIELSKTKLTPLGQGSGMLGLPGDFTSPSRFIRAVAFSQSVVNLDDEQKTLDAAFHILNLFDIPYGVVREKINNDIHYEYTQWTSAADLKNKKYYIHTYDDRNIKEFDLSQNDLNSQKPIFFDK